MPLTSMGTHALMSMEMVRRDDEAHCAPLEMPRGTALCQTGPF